MTSTVSPPQYAVDLRTLGSLDLRTADGAELRSALAQGKRMALLSYLAIAKPRGFHRRDTLVGLFWPETDQRHSRAALRQALHFLRQSLGRDVVINRGPEEIGVDFAKLNCDVVCFEECLERGATEQASELYGGPLLKGFFVHDAPEFERWLAIERDRLAQLYADALRSLAERAADSGDFAAATRWWKRLTNHDPYNSEVALKLMTALEAAGDRVGAIAHAQVHTDAVRSELEVDPDAKVMELACRLKCQTSQGGSIAVVEPSPTPTAIASNTATAPEIAPNEIPVTWPPRRYMLATILVLVACVSTWFAFPRSSPFTGPPMVSLAVLPFENLGSPEDEYLVVGLAEDIVNRLAGVQRLSLVGPNDGGLVTHDDPEGFTAAGASAEFLLRGSIERVVHADGTASIRWIPSLARVDNGAQIWTATIEENIEQVFDGQIRIAEEVSRLLGLSPLSTEREWLRATPTHIPVAYDQFLLGNEKLRQASNSIDDTRDAIEHFESAIAHDSLFVQAHAKLAIAHTSMFWWNHDHTPQRLVAAKAAADRAVQLRPDIPHSHLALGWYYYWGERDYDRALRHFEMARSNWPGVSDVLVLIAAIRRRQGDFERAIDNHHEAAANDPSCATCFAGAAFTHLLLRDYDAADQDVGRALAVAPDFSYAQRVGTLTRLNSSGDTSGARNILPPLESTSQMIAMGTGHWSAIPRILSAECDAFTAEMELTPDIADTAGYYLLKAELATRHGRTATATAYYDSARTVLLRLVVDLPEDPRLRGQLGLAYAGLGMHEEAVQEGTEATRLRPMSEDAVDGPLAVETLARIYTMLGDHDTAIDRLEMLLSVPSHLSSHSLRLDPVWVPLRQHERFLRLTR